jgi:hypothetical protein
MVHPCNLQAACLQVFAILPEWELIELSAAFLIWPH